MNKVESVVIILASRSKVRSFLPFCLFEMMIIYYSFYLVGVLYLNFYDSNKKFLAVSLPPL